MINERDFFFFFAFLQEVKQCDVTLPGAITCTVIFHSNAALSEMEHIYEEVWDKRRDTEVRVTQIKKRQKAPKYGETLIRIGRRGTRRGSELQPSSNILCLFLNKIEGYRNKKRPNLETF